MKQCALLFGLLFLLCAGSVTAQVPPPPGIYTDPLSQDGGSIYGSVTYAPHPAPRQNDPADWIGYTALWEYVIPPNEAVNVRVQIVWTGCFTTLDAKGNKVKSYTVTKSVYDKLIPGTTNDAGAYPFGPHGTQTTTPVAVSGLRTLLLNIASGTHGYGLYFYTLKLFMERDTYGSKLADTRMSQFSVVWDY